MDNDLGHKLIDPSLARPLDFSYAVSPKYVQVVRPGLNYIAESENHCDNVLNGFQGNQADQEVKETITGVVDMDGVRGDPYNSRALPPFLIVLRWGAAPVVL